MFKCVPNLLVQLSARLPGSIGQGKGKGRAACGSLMVGYPRWPEVCARTALRTIAPKCRREGRTANQFYLLQRCRITPRQQVVSVLTFNSLLDTSTRKARQQQALRRSAVLDTQGDGTIWGYLDITPSAIRTLRSTRRLPS